MYGTDFPSEARYYTQEELMGTQPPAPMHKGDILVTLEAPDVFLVVYNHNGSKLNPVDFFFDDVNFFDLKKEEQHL